MRALLTLFLAAIGLMIVGCGSGPKEETHDPGNTTTQFEMKESEGAANAPSSTDQAQQDE